MNKKQFKDTLQACYFGDREAFNKIVKEYNKLHNKIDKAIEYMKPRFMNCIDNNKRFFADDYIQEIYEILKDSDVDEIR